MNQLQYDFIDIYSLTPDETASALSMMTEQKRCRVQRLAREDDRLRSAAAEHLARRMLSERLRLAPEEIRLGQLESGQPTVDGLTCFISLSHSGRWAMCALCDTPVGADIEVIGNRGRRTVSRICSEPEKEYIFSSGEFDPIRFFRVWTAKEACVKRSGEGISAGLSSCTVAERGVLLTSVGEHRLISGIHMDAAYAIVY